MTDNEEKKPRGGKREGAGRKPPAIPLKRYQVMLNDEQRETATKLGHGNLSLGVRTAIEVAIQIRRQGEAILSARPTFEVPPD
jgi:hypothetical protein